MNALSAAFQKFPTNSGPNTVPQVSVHSAHFHQYHMSISNALPHIQLRLGTQDSEKLLDGMFDSGAGLNFGCRTYNEDIMRRNPDLVAGIHRFEDIGTDPISLGGITVDGAAPRVTAFISYKLPYVSNGSARVFKIALTEAFSIRTIFGTPFQRKEKLTYMPYMNQVVIHLWCLAFTVSFKKSESTINSPSQGPGAVLQVAPTE
jgi:hypothetical protein